MLIYGSQIIGLPVGSLEDNKKIGRVKKILVDKNGASVPGFIVHIDGVFGPNLFLSSQDIVGADRHGIVTNRSENIVATEEVLAAKNIIEERFNLFGLPARINHDKKRFGNVSDFIIDTESFQIVKFCLKGLWEDRIFPLSEVHKITNSEIIFDKDIEIDKSSKKFVRDFSS